MFCDIPSDMPLTKGDNISPTLSTDDKDEIHRVFEEFADDGEVLMPLEKTFWSELYGMVQDKYGVIWQLSLDGNNMA
jgi:PhnB protein